VTDIFKHHFLYTPDVSLLVSSYVDDAVIRVAATSQELAMEVMRCIFKDCWDVGGGQNMRFGLLKMV